MSKKLPLAPDMTLSEQVADLILEVANLYNDVDTSDLQGIASVKASEIIALIKAQLTTTVTDIVPVHNWNSTEYDGDEATSQRFNMEITDHRKSSGQLYIDVATEEGEVDDLLCATVEISRLPGSKDDTQCLRLHFDGSNLAASFFKQGGKFIIRPETDVSIRSTVLPNGELGWILE